MGGDLTLVYPGWKTDTKLTVDTEEYNRKSPIRLE